MAKLISEVIVDGTKTPEKFIFYGRGTPFTESPYPPPALQRALWAPPPPPRCHKTSPLTPQNTSKTIGYCFSLLKNCFPNQKNCRKNDFSFFLPKFGLRCVENFNAAQTKFLQIEIAVHNTPARPPQNGVYSPLPWTPLSNLL